MMEASRVLGWLQGGSPGRPCLLAAGSYRVLGSPVTPAVWPFRLGLVLEVVCVCGGEVGFPSVCLHVSPSVLLVLNSLGQPSVHPEHPLSSKVSRLPSAEVLMGGGGEILQEAGPTNALHV